MPYAPHMSQHNCSKLVEEKFLEKEFRRVISSGSRQVESISESFIFTKCPIKGSKNMINMIGWDAKHVNFI